MPKHKAGNLKTPDYYLFQGQDQKNFFFTLKYIHGSVHFMQKILLSLSETMIKLHLFKMHSVKPYQSLICPANACQSILIVYKESFGLKNITDLLSIP